MDIPDWENEGGYLPLTICSVCDRFRTLYHDGKCRECWTKEKDNV